MNRLMDVAGTWRERLRLSSRPQELAEEQVGCRVVTGTVVYSPVYSPVNSPVVAVFVIVRFDKSCLRESSKGSESVSGE